MAENDDGQILPKRQAHVDKLPSVRCQIGPCRAFVSGAHSQDPHLLGDHDAVDGVDHDIFDVFEIIL